MGPKSTTIKNFKENTKFFINIKKTSFPTNITSLTSVRVILTIFNGGIYCNTCVILNIVICDTVFTSGFIRINLTIGYWWGDWLTSSWGIYIKMLIAFSACTIIINSGTVLNHFLNTESIIVKVIIWKIAEQTFLIWTLQTTLNAPSV